MFILFLMFVFCMCFFFSSRRRHTRLQGDWSSDVCSSDLFVVFPEWIYEVIWSSACPALLQCPRRNQVGPGVGVHFTSYQPLRTSLPIMVPDSRRVWALRRFAPVIGEILSLSVERSLPASTRSATWFRSLCCSIMSGVLKRGRVNMSSQQSVALFARTVSMGSGLVFPTMATSAPCGATISDIASQ